MSYNSIVQCEGVVDLGKIQGFVWGFFFFFSFF